LANTRAAAESVSTERVRPGHDAAPKSCPFRRAGTSPGRQSAVADARSAARTVDALAGCPTRARPVLARASGAQRLRALYSRSAASAANSCAGRIRILFQVEELASPGIDDVFVRVFVAFVESTPAGLRPKHFGFSSALMGANLF
jgi:hypothetical protein